MKVLEMIELWKERIAKFWVFISTIFLYKSIISRIFFTENMTQLYITIDLYILIIITVIFLDLFMNCCLCRLIQSNFPMIRHFTGKGILYLLVSVFYLTKPLRDEAFTSLILLISVGLICLMGDIRLVKKNSTIIENLEKSGNLTMKTSEINVISTEESVIPNCKKAFNPYDPPGDDF
jgi:hypothetical protein